MKKIIVLLVYLHLSICFSQRSKEDLIVFVGEKISLEEIYPTINNNVGKYQMDFLIHTDHVFLAKYKVLEQINGKQIKDTIEFKAFDNMENPNFSKFDNVLLFLIKKNGVYYLERNLFFDVYLTENNRWASPYNYSAYNHPYKNSFSIIPERIPFIKDTFYDLENVKVASISELFPEIYFNIIDNKAYPIYGNYIKDLLTLQLEGVLRARGYH